MKNIYTKAILDEKLKFLWDNIMIYDYYSSITRINRRTINFNSFYLEQALKSGEQLIDSTFYREYHNLLENVISDKQLESFKLKNKKMSIHERIQKMHEFLPEYKEEVSEIEKQAYKEYEIATSKLKCLSEDDNDKFLDGKYNKHFEGLKYINENNTNFNASNLSNLNFYQRLIGLKQDNSVIDSYNNPTIDEINYVLYSNPNKGIELLMMNPKSCNNDTLEIIGLIIGMLDIIQLFNLNLLLKNYNVNEKNNVSKARTKSLTTQINSIMDFRSKK